MALPQGILFNDPQAKPLSTSGQFQAGSYYLFYLTGTTTPANVYADGALTTPLSQTPGQTQPSCTADGFGRFNPIYMNPAIVYRVQLFSSTNVKLEDIDPYVVPLTAGGLTQSIVGQALYPQTAAEISAGVTPVNYSYPPNDVRRYGGSPGASASVNNAAIASAVAVGKYSGVIYFCAGTWAYSGTSVNSPYSTTNPLWIQYGDITVYGDGIDVTILAPSGWIDGILIGSSAYPAVSSILSGVTVRDLTINGTGIVVGGGTDTAGNQLNLNGCDYVNVQRVKSVNQLYQGIVSTYFGVSGSTQQSLTITDCTVTNVPANREGIGVEGNVSNCILSNNFVLGNLAIGILASTGTSGTFGSTGKVQIYGNHVEGPTGTGTIGIAVFDGAYQSNVFGNTVIGADISIRLASFSGSTHISNCLISNNYCINWTTVGISVFPLDGTDPSNAKVVGNLLESANASGSSDGIIAGKGCSITGNTINAGVTGILCAGGGQKITANDITATSTSIDTLTTTSTGVVCSANVVNVSPNLNPDTVYQRVGGYGGTIASAATINIPVSGDFFQITGTTNIVSIGGSNNQNNGANITFEFAGVLTVVNGSNIRLNSSGNFTTAAGSTLTLRCSSNQWYEVSRTP